MHYWNESCTDERTQFVVFRFPVELLVCNAERMQAQHVSFGSLRHPPKVLTEPSPRIHKSLPSPAFSEPSVWAQSFYAQPSLRRGASTPECFTFNEPTLNSRSPNSSPMDMSRDTGSYKRRGSLNDVSYYKPRCTNNNVVSSSVRRQSNQGKMQYRSANQPQVQASLSNFSGRNSLRSNINHPRTSDRNIKTRLSDKISHSRSSSRNSQPWSSDLRSSDQINQSRCSDHSSHSRSSDNSSHSNPRSSDHNHHRHRRFSVDPTDRRELSYAEIHEAHIARKAMTLNPRRRASPTPGELSRSPSVSPTGERRRSTRRKSELSRLSEYYSESYQNVSNAGSPQHSPKNIPNRRVVRSHPAVAIEHEFSPVKPKLRRSETTPKRSEAIPRLRSETTPTRSDNTVRLRSETTPTRSDNTVRLLSETTSERSDTVPPLSGATPLRSESELVPTADCFPDTVSPKSKLALLKKNRRPSAARILRRQSSQQDSSVAAGGPADDAGRPISGGPADDAGGTISGGPAHPNSDVRSSQPMPRRMRGRAVSDISELRRSDVESPNPAGSRHRPSISAGSSTHRLAIANARRRRRSGSAPSATGTKLDSASGTKLSPVKVRRSLSTDFDMVGRKPYRSQVIEAPSPKFEHRSRSDVRHLDADLDALVGVLSTKDSDWQCRMDALAKVRQVARMELPTSRLVRLLAKLRGPLVTQLSELRSTLIKSVCQTISEIFEVLGDKYARTAGLYLSPLFKLLQSSGAMASPANLCLQSMLANVHFPYLIEFLLDRAGTSKAEVLRVKATAFLCKIVNDPAWRHMPHFKDTNRFQELTTFVVKQTDDSSNEVRGYARKLAGALGAAFPKLAAAVEIYSRVGTRTKRLLADEHPDVFGSDALPTLGVDSRRGSRRLGRARTAKTNIVPVYMNNSRARQNRTAPARNDPLR
eukprot:884769_1